MRPLVKNLHIGKLFIVTFMAFLPMLAQARPVQKYVNLGNFKLENGQTIKNCVIGYRTSGKLNSSRSNAVLFLTYFSGKSGDLLSMTGPNMMADSTKYFVISIDAFGDGVTSSPSNSKLQPNGFFPRYNIRDMVRAQHILVTKFLKLTHVFCVMGLT